MSHAPSTEADPLSTPPPPPLGPPLLACLLGSSTQFSLAASSMLVSFVASVAHKHADSMNAATVQHINQLDTKTSAQLKDLHDFIEAERGFDRSFTAERTEAAAD